MGPVRCFLRGRLHTQCTIPSSCQAEKDAGSRTRLKMKQKKNRSVFPSASNAAKVVTHQRRRQLLPAANVASSLPSRRASARRPRFSTQRSSPLYTPSTQILTRNNKVNGGVEGNDKSEMTNKAADASPVPRRRELSEVPIQKVAAPAPTRAPSRCLACRANERSGPREAGRMGGEGMGEEEGEERCQKFTHAQDIIFCRGPELPVHGKI